MLKRAKVEFVMAVLLLFMVFFVARQAGMMVAGEKVEARTSKPVVVIDAGHGGIDPGKVGVDGSLEKDINIAISLKLKEYLESSDVEVILTREKDKGLYKEGDSSKKRADMKKRCEVINDAKADVVISIHQNSYHQESINGAQVFYYTKSEKGRTLAEVIQRRFDYVLGDRNKRQAKANDNYYLLLHVKSPIVIVECGFLSNKKEAGLLNDKEYQDKIAWTIHMGVMEFLNGR